MTTRLTKQDIVRILPVNDLLYTREEPQSVVVSRTQKKSFSEGSGTKYTPGDHIVINLQSGNDFIDPLQSFLVFELRCIGQSAELLGSVLNVISDSQISSRSGKEMSRNEALNVLNYHMIKDTPNNFLTHNLNAILGAQDSNVETTFAGNTRSTVGTTFKKYMIPLKYISSIFDTERLMPPHLARGLKIDITLESLNRAFFTSGTAPTGYEIQRPYVLTDSYTIADSVYEYLNAEFASKETGLVYEYSDHNTTRTTNSTATMDVEVRRAVSMATDVFCVTSLSSLANDIANDSFASHIMEEGDKWFWRVGSHYLPNQPVEGQVEAYAQYLYWKDALRGDAETGVLFNEFTGTAATTGTPGAQTVNRGLGKMCCVLSRNAVLDLAGLPLANSSSLALTATMATGDTRNVYVFLRHIRRGILYVESLVLET